MPAPTRTTPLLRSRLARPGAALLLVLTAAVASGCGAGSTTDAVAPSAASAPSASSASSASSTPSAATPSPAVAQPAAPSAESPAKSVPAADGPTVTVDNFAYDVPATVSPGATVVVDNVDVETHTLTAKGDGGFAVTVPVDGQGTFVAPTAPGDYPFNCLLHGGMEGVLTVG